VENKLPSTMFAPERENRGTGIVLHVVAVYLFSIPEIHQS